MMPIDPKNPPQLSKPAWRVIAICAGLLNAYVFFSFFASILVAPSLQTIINLIGVWLMLGWVFKRSVARGWPDAEWAEAFKIR